MAQQQHQKSTPTTTTTEHANADVINFAESPEIHANWFSRRTFWWLNKIMSHGSKFVLHEPDLYQVTPEIEAKQLTQRFDVEWKIELEKQHQTKSSGVVTPHIPSAQSVLYRLFRHEIWLAGICCGIRDGLSFLQPILLEWILVFLKDTQSDDPNVTHPHYRNGFIYAGAIGVIPIIQTICNGTHFQIMATIGIKVRTILITQIYKKALRLSPEAKQAMSTGQIVNMMATDTTKIDVFCGFAQWSWSIPCQVFAAMALLIRAIGPPALSGIAVICVLFPIQTHIFAYILRTREVSMKVTDSRIKLMNEILQGIRVIKVYAYENSFLQKMIGIRNKEMTYIKGMAYARGYNWGMLGITPILMSLLAFLTLALSSSSFSPEFIFQAVVLFDMLRIPLQLFPQLIALGVDSRVGIKRINDFLLAGELKWAPEYVDDPKVAVRVESAHFAWTAMKEEPAAAAAKKATTGDKKKGTATSDVPMVKIEKVEKDTKTAIVPVTASAVVAAAPEAKVEVLPFHLNDVNLTIPHGSLTVIVGSVGAGKSSLLAGILGEMKRVRGAVKLSGSVGYCPQQAWIQNATLKENILFGLPFDRMKYADAIKYSALEADINVLPARDLTEIGEKGINLSGGQKQRVNLARAIYFDADIVMFDDPLSAVDAHVSKYLFNECIQQKLKNKTRILVTHQLQYVSSCDHVLFIENGKITESGSYTQLMAKKGNFFTLMSTYIGEEDDKVDEDMENEQKSQDGSKTKGLKTAKSSASSNPKTETAKKDSVMSEADMKKLETEKAASKKLIEDEERKKGEVPWKTYASYMLAAGGWPWLSFALFLLCAQTAAATWSTWWLNLWTSDHYNQPTHFYLTIYAAIGIITSIFALVSALAVAHTGTIAAHHLHNASFRSVLRAPMSFFDTTPIGRIINRFSKDQSVLDDQLMDLIRGALFMGFTIISTLIIIAIVIPYFLLPCVPVMGLYWYVQSEYRKTSLEIKRLESISRSPIFAHFSETLTGLSTIRAYRAENAFIQTNEERMNGNNRVYYIQAMIAFWLAFRVKIVGALISFSAAMIIVLQRNTITSSQAGLTLSYAASVTTTFTWFAPKTAAVENDMNSVERSFHYTNEIAQEAPAMIAETDESLKTTWPKEGAIEFSDLKIRYRDNLPLVLHGISLSIRGGERIGVVGRTGAGKSSLMVALFRLVEAAHGQISIDGIDISKIGLDALRNKLAIIPQDAVLYSGTIRSNLDPFSKYTDAELWSALEKSHLKDMISSLEKKLLDPVSEGGENFSVGQRCQICLARAILRNAKILIMDEATASVDMATDAYIQNSLRKNFNCTLLTIAHRLNTIVDYDRVLVLSFGRVQEFDSPANLLRNPNSAFSSMVNETGEVNAALLRTIAFKAEKGIRVDAADLLAMEGAELIGSPSNVLASNQQQQQPSTIQTSVTSPAAAAAIDYLPVEPFLEVSRNHPSYSHVNWHNDGEDEEDLSCMNK